MEKPEKSLKTKNVVILRSKTITIDKHTRRRRIGGGWLRNVLFVP